MKEAIKPEIYGLVKMPDRHPSFEDWEYEDDDVNIDIESADYDIEVEMNSQNYLLLRGTATGEVFLQSNGPRSYNLLALVRGLDKFISKTEELEAEGKKYLIPQLLYGDTNQKMANFVKRLGFSEVVTDLGTYGDVEVLAPFSLVKEKVADFRNNPIFSKLETRAEREKLRYDAAVVNLPSLNCLSFLRRRESPRSTSEDQWR